MCGGDKKRDGTLFLIDLSTGVVGRYTHQPKRFKTSMISETNELAEINWV